MGETGLQNLHYCMLFVVGSNR